MAYNHRKAIEEFDAQQKKNIQMYRATGMTDYQIEEMYKFDFETFGSDRKFHEHCDSGIGVGFEKSERYLRGNMAPEFPKEKPKKAWSMKHFRTFDENWLDELGEEMQQLIRGMKAEEIYILGEILKGRTHAEIACDMGICRQNVERRYRKIREKLKKYPA